ncbi:YybH family protein [Riemerella columbina]|uniref:YybH family protein n=1 Tax=Riemerella columbina TaxID=103810 RepID=UPI00036A1AD5|nr:nuclear transport factor 2 family protein [Riemerella columbina]
MKRLLIFVALSLSALFFAQEKDIISVMHTQQDSWNQGDLEGFMQGYWNSPELVFIGSKGKTYGWEQTLANYKKAYRTKAEMGTLSFSNIEVKMLGENYALVTGNWALKRQPKDIGGIYSLIFQKFEDGWKIILDHTN